MTDRPPGFATLAVHAGAQPDPTTGARSTPIYQTTSFVFNDADHAASLFGLQAFGNIYTRIGNPTNAVLEERVAALEGGTAALAVASGHAAQVVVLQQLLKPGDEFIAARKLYGGSINQFTHAFKSFGWNVAWADPDDIQTFERAVTPQTKAIFIESIANPSGSITDIEAIAAVARKAGVPLIVDNTLASPYLIRPIEHGADIVVHSLTKFLAGHGNSLGGIEGQQISDAERAAPGISRHPAAGNLRQFRFCDRLPCPRSARSWSGVVAIQRIHDPHRNRDAAVAHAEALREHEGDCRVAVQPSGSIDGQLFRVTRQPLLQSRPQICAEGRGRGVHLQPQGRIRCRRQPGG
jgi:hypothetical protein